MAYLYFTIMIICVLAIILGIILVTSKKLPVKVNEIFSKTKKDNSKLYRVVILILSSLMILYSVVFILIFGPKLYRNTYPEETDLYEVIKNTNTINMIYYTHTNDDYNNREMDCYQYKMTQINPVYSTYFIQELKGIKTPKYTWNEIDLPDTEKFKNTSYCFQSNVMISHIPYPTFIDAVLLDSKGELIGVIIFYNNNEAYFKTKEGKFLRLKGDIKDAYEILESKQEGDEAINE